MPEVFAKPALISLSGFKLTDHNRSPLDIDFERIENVQRMANGAMRKQVIATKHKFGLDWTDIPHSAAYTVDGFAGGEEMLNMWQTITGPTNLTVTWGDGRVNTYYVVISNFTYSIKKRGKYDFWDASMELEEV